MAEQDRTKRGDVARQDTGSESLSARSERREATRGDGRDVRTDGPPGARVREEDLEPHAGLRYIARLFKVLSVILVLMLIAEIVIGLSQDGTAAIGTLIVQATRLIVFAAFLWAAGDLALMMIDSNHDLRAVRILLGRINSRMQTSERPNVTLEHRPAPQDRIPPGVL